MFANFAVMKVYHDIKRILAEGGMEAGEASAVAWVLLEDLCGMSKVDVLMGKEPEDAEELERAARRVAEGEPVQYVTGKAMFCDLEFRVEPGVLIPRCETEELVRMIERHKPKSILDIGTGSGCIAVSLAHLLPEARVEAIDVSDDALTIAKRNAEKLKADVHFIKKDILTENVDGRYECVVSNPPYICDSEAEDMESNVLDHEPHLALFVPDSDPLLFYRRIAEVALRILYNNGVLAFEINRRFGKEIEEMLSALGYTDIEVMKDQFGNDRMVKAIKL